MEDNLAILDQWSIPTNFKGSCCYEDMEQTEFKDIMYRHKPNFTKIVCINAFIFAEPKHTYLTGLSERNKVVVKSVVA